MQEEFETPDPHGPLLVAIWIGALILWAFTGFKGSFKSQLNYKDQSKNIWVGYITQLILIAVLAYVIYKG